MSGSWIRNVATDKFNLTTIVNIVESQYPICSHACTDAQQFIVYNYLIASGIEIVNQAT